MLMSEDSLPNTEKIVNGALTPAAVKLTDDYRRRKRAAVLAILFTDLENSTSLRERMGEQAYESLREEHDDVLARTITADDAGAVVASTGDGVLAVFSEPSTAVSRALAIQRALHNHPLLRVRVGIDMGQVSEERAGGVVVGVYGRHVNRAARVQALAEPTHVLTTFQVYDCSVGWLYSAGIVWHDHGGFNLKGFDTPVSIWEPLEPASLPQKLGNPSVRLVAPTFDAVDVERWGGYMAKAALDLGAPEAQGDRGMYLDATPPPRGLLPTLRHIARLAREATPSLLWVDAVPERNALIRRWLEGVGCGITLAQSTDNANSLLKTTVNFDLAISYLQRSPSGRPKPFSHPDIPVIIFASVQDIAHYRAMGERGAVLCTSGTASAV